MKIIKPWIEIKSFDGIQIMKNLELAAKQCYRSQNNITEDSYKKFLANCLNRGHESVIEHEKISIRMCCDIGCYKDLSRHRHASFSIESTRYCNYGKDKFENEIKFIEPVFYQNSWSEGNYEGRALTLKENKSKLWYNAMKEAEYYYMEMTKLGCAPDEMRMILPHSTAAELYMTANIREWRHILSLRADSHAHPSVQQVMIPLLLYFKNQMPELFNDIEFNNDFDKTKYAEIKII